MQRIVQFIGTSTLKANKSEVFATRELDATSETEDGIWSHFNFMKIWQMQILFYTHKAISSVLYTTESYKSGGSVTALNSEKRFTSTVFYCAVFERKKM